MNTHLSVGKNVANWNPFFANWIQLADPCQLDFLTNQALPDQLASWQVGNAANLPTEISHCFYSVCNLFSVVGNSPSYYVGEGTKVPSHLRGGLSGVGNGFDNPYHPYHPTSILALDLGTHTGWALHHPDGTITSGTEHFQPGRFEGGGMRYLRFKRWLTEVKQAADGIDAVYFEEVRRHAGVDAAHAYGGFMAHLTAWCEHHQIPYQGVPVGTIKKHATGKGNAGKEAVMAAMQAKGFAPGDDNEADALALLDWALAQTVEGACHG